MQKGCEQHLWHTAVNAVDSTQVVKGSPGQESRIGLPRAVNTRVCTAWDWEAPCAEAPKAASLQIVLRVYL